MKKLCLIFCFMLTAGCMRPLYETDYPVYRQYKYWESADKDWQEIDYFQVQAFRTKRGDQTALRLVPQRDGLPSTRDGYLQAAQKAAFNIMTSVCGASFVSPLPAQATNMQTSTAANMTIAINANNCLLIPSLRIMNVLFFEIFLPGVFSGNLHKSIRTQYTPDYEQDPVLMPVAPFPIFGPVSDLRSVTRRLRGLGGWGALSGVRSLIGYGGGIGITAACRNCQQDCQQQNHQQN